MQSCSSAGPAGRSSITAHFEVDFLHPVEHPLVGVVLDAMPSRGGAELASQRRIAREARYRGCQSVPVARRYDKRSDLVACELADAADWRRHAGQPAE